MNVLDSVVTPSQLRRPMSLSALALTRTLLLRIPEHVVAPSTSASSP
jgi:hypothetical protein